MQIINSNIQLAAGDLSNHLSCSHLTWLNLQVVLKKIEAPTYRDPALKILQERGLDFEKAYLKKLQEEGLRIAKPEPDGDSLSIDRTIEEMKKGVDVIYQASLAMDHWQGRADFLLKVPIPSKLGAWSYEVADTKLANDTRAATILQICLYSQILATIQGRIPEFMHVIKPSESFLKESYRVDDYIAYTRLIQRKLLQAIKRAEMDPETYPNPVAHCDICRWWQNCSQQRRKDDHLSLVAGLSTNHKNELERRSINTMESLSLEPIPLNWRPAKGAMETYTKLREQARLQIQARNQGGSVYEKLPLEPGTGIYKLPEPSEGDIFFDFEGDAFAGTNGMEYLFGHAFLENGQEHYQALWALNAVDEKQAFGQFINWVMERWQYYPDLHIYHFSPYEPSALKRLMGKYATCEREVDQLLRANLFVDLLTITRQSIRAGVESYSLKELEIFHGFVRRLALREAALQLRTLERLLETGQVESISLEIKEQIQQYNQDDCSSTRSLRNWLESIRSSFTESGTEIPRPKLETGDPSEEMSNSQAFIMELYNQLTNGISVNREERYEEEQARWLLANMLDWYWREKKSKWWEYYRVKELSEEELLDEKSAISGMVFTGERRLDKKSVVDRYQFPPQDYDLSVGKKVECTKEAGIIGEIIDLDSAMRTVDLKKGPSKKDIHPCNIFLNEIIDDGVKQESILRLAKWVVTNGLKPTGLYAAGLALLQKLDPSYGVLPIQGPPGAGKSHTASLKILELIRQGKQVGITALSHKVIQGLLKKVVVMGREAGIHVSCLHKVSEISESAPPGIRESKDNGEVLAAIQNGSAQVFGATAWTWAREEFARSVDVLFVDEAGQLSLIDTLAVSHCAVELVLLGDPQQLKQPIQGIHPEGTALSALEHILDGHPTIPEGKGQFLDTTWRMHPNICRFISEQFYESRLAARENLANQQISGNSPFAGAGLWYVPIVHNGNQSDSVEEAETVSSIVASLLNGQNYWIDENEVKRLLRPDDIKVIAPYNAQVGKLKLLLQPEIQVGTVDKFQGQEAPVVIFSMSSSSPADAPRGMEFLYSPNRLNVAVSRARGAFILVASPKLFEPDCKSPQQIKLANGYCRYLELVKEN